MMKLIMEYYDKAVLAYENGAPLNSIISIPERESIGRFKYLPEDKTEAEYEKLINNIDTILNYWFFDERVSKFTYDVHFGVEAPFEIEII